MEVDPVGCQMCPSSSQSRRRSPNTQWSTLGRTSPHATGIRKKKGVDPTIVALQSQLSHATDELGEQLDATSQFAGHAPSTAQTALQHAQAAKEESAQMGTMIDETLRTHLAQTSLDTQLKLDAVAASLAQQLVHATESTCRVDYLILAKRGQDSLVCSPRKPLHFTTSNLDKFRPF